MKVDSRPVTTIPDDSSAPPLSSSEHYVLSAGPGTIWIQPSVSQQSFDLSSGSLIDGIYVRTAGDDALYAVVSGYHADPWDEFAQMAADSDIQRELSAIQSEFAQTDIDGLDVDIDNL